MESLSPPSNLWLGIWACGGRRSQVDLRGADMITETSGDAGDATQRSASPRAVCGRLAPLPYILDKDAEKTESNVLLAHATYVAWVPNHTAPIVGFERWDKLHFCCIVPKSVQ